MALWQIGDRPASVVGNPSTYVPGSSSQTSGKPVIIYPNADGTTGGSKPNYNPSGSSSDPYGGVPININTSQSSAKEMQSLVGTLGDAITGVQGSMNQGFKGLMNLIKEQTANNNAYSAAQAQKQMEFQDAMNQRAMEFNSLEAAKNRDWQRLMSNTAHQREVADLKAAGLNPVLSASGGNGAAVGSGATAAGAGSPSGAMSDADQSGNSAMASIFGALMAAQTSMYNANLSAQTNLAMTEKQVAAQMYGQELAARTSLANAELGAEASKYAAGTAYAASAYNADMNYKNNEEQRKWNADHPSNVYQTASSLFGNSGVSGAKETLKTEGKNFLSNVAKWFFDRD